jgi:hypothetical protein
MWEENGGKAPPFLVSALDGGGWPASRHCRFIPREITTAGLDSMENIEILPLLKLKPRPTYLEPLTVVKILNRDLWDNGVA